MFYNFRGENQIVELTKTIQPGGIVLREILKIIESVFDAKKINKEDLEKTIIAFKKECDDKKG